MQKDSTDDSAELMDKALELLRTPDDDDSNNQARGWIQYAVETFRRELEEKPLAPRLRRLSEQTIGIAASAGELARLLDESAPYLARAAVGYLSADDWKDDRGVPHLSEVLDPKQLAELTDRVKRLSVLATRLCTSIPIDSGGGRNLTTLFDGAPRWNLAVRCWEVFSWFRPGEATGYREGDFYRLVEMVFYLATGEESKSGLERVVALAAKRCNSYATHRPAYERLRRGSEGPFMLVEAGVAALMSGAPTGFLLN